MNKKKVALTELEDIVRSERLGKVFDVLEPRAQRLAKAPSAVSFGVLFGALFLILGIVLGQLASIYIHLAAPLVGIVIFAFMAAGIATGNLVATGRKGLRLERKGRALERFIGPLLPVLVQINQKPATRELAVGLREAISLELEPKPPAKQLLPAEPSPAEPIPE